MAEPRGSSRAFVIDQKYNIEYGYLSVDSGRLTKSLCLKNLQLPIY